MDNGSAGIFGVGTPQFQHATGLFDKLSDPCVNDAGTVSFAQVKGRVGTIIKFQLSPQSVTDTTGAFKRLGAPAINDAGAVAFFATRDAGGSGVYRSDGAAASLTTMVDTDHPFFERFFSRSLNDAGVVALRVTAQGKDFTLASAAEDAPAVLTWEGEEIR